MTYTIVCFASYLFSDILAFCTWFNFKCSILVLFLIINDDIIFHCSGSL